MKGTCKRSEFYIPHRVLITLYLCDRVPNCGAARHFSFCSHSGCTGRGDGAVGHQGGESRDVSLVTKEMNICCLLLFVSVLISFSECIFHGIMGRRFPDGGLLRYRKWVPQQLGDGIVVTNSPPIGLMRSQLTNHQVGIVLDVQAWSEKLY